jgi:hypothetical protein
MSLFETKQTNSAGDFLMAKSVGARLCQKIMLQASAPNDGAVTALAEITFLQREFQKRILLGLAGGAFSLREAGGYQ